MTDFHLNELDRRTFLATSATLIASTNMLHADAPPLAPPDKQPAHLQVPEVPSKTIGFAIVGLGQLALEQVLPAFAKCKVARPVALVSGHPDKAKKVAAAYGIDPRNLYNYQTYDKLADNREVDAIYIILPNSMHAEYTIRGFKAGKHVLCEKPMAISVAECTEMIAASKAANRKLMIAYRLRYEPFNMLAIDLCHQGELGKIKSITASHCQDVQAPNIRLSKALGGGPVGDVGIYCINAFRYLSGEEPVDVTATEYQPQDDTRFREVPESVAFTLRFPSGLLGCGDCSFGTAESRCFRVQGGNGILDMESAFGYRGQRLLLHKNGRLSEYQLAPVDHFAAEMDAFSESILTNQIPKTPGEEGLADIRIIEAIEESIRTGRISAVRH
ncbi:MAG: gfo/Idh/MocA family oxidoreductase [Planctomycetaceae bacterium]|nr:gfo/Idh/MocA family oxidoreductase [Planctomycetaceae bacterium]